jgi:hypothetical protein
MQSSEASASIMKLAPICEQLGIDVRTPFSSNSADSIAELLNASVLTTDIRPARIVDGSNISKASYVSGTTTGTPCIIEVAANERVPPSRASVFIDSPT